eukprot:4198126-Pyramimonas_sp.AAC.1
MSMGSMSSCGSVAKTGTAASDGLGGPALSFCVISMGSISSCGSVAMTETAASDGDGEFCFGSDNVSTAEDAGATPSSCDVSINSAGPCELVATIG